MFYYTPRRLGHVADVFFLACLFVSFFIELICAHARLFTPFRLAFVSSPEVVVRKSLIGLF